MYMFVSVGIYVHVCTVPKEVRGVELLGVGVTGKCVQGIELRFSAKVL